MNLNIDDLDFICELITVEAASLYDEGKAERADEVFEIKNRIIAQTKDFRLINSFKREYANANGTIDTMMPGDIYAVLAHYGFTEAGLGLADLRRLAREEMQTEEGFEEYCRAYDVPTDGAEYEWSIKLGVVLAWLLNN
jgi:hypothetical protein